MCLCVSRIWIIKEHLKRNIMNSSRDDGTVSDQDFRLYIEPFGAQLVRFVLDGLIFIVGVLGNGLVCVVVVKENLLRSLAYCLIFNLAISDLGVLLFSLPFAVFRLELNSWPLGAIGCRVLYPLSDIFHGASIATITAIAVFRYRGIVSGNSVGKTSSALKKAKLVILLIWLLSFVLFVVPLFFAMNYATMQGGKTYCFPTFPLDLYYKLYQAETVLLTYLLPLAVITLTYVRIRRRLRESIALHVQIRQQSGSPSSRLKRQHLSEKNYKALKVLTPVVVVFSVTMFPYNVYRVVDIFLDTSQFVYQLVFFKLCVLFFVCNSSANPLIYALFSEEFRKAFKWHIRHCSRKASSRFSSFSGKVNSARSHRFFFSRSSARNKDRASSSASDVFV